MYFAVKFIPKIECCEIHFSGLPDAGGIHGHAPEKGADLETGIEGQGEGSSFSSSLNEGKAMHALSMIQGRTREHFGNCLGKSSGFAKEGWS